MTSGLTLTAKQSRAKDEVLRWYADPYSKQTFYFAGVGGTGKSTCVEHIVREISGRVLFAAFTGKAASVMRKKGCPGATTIHRLAYRPAGDPPTPEQIEKLRDEIKRLYALEDPKSHTLADALVEELKRSEQQSKRQGPRFSLNAASEIKYAKLVVIDECSFVDERVGQDLESFGTKLLVLGDPAQLPPVFGQGYFTSREPDVFLDEILRQELGNPIRQLCEKARKGERLTYGKYGDSEVLPYGDPSIQDKVLAADVVIVGRNRTRHACNAKIRRLLGRVDSPAPVEGDRVICLRNDHDRGLLNGTQWRVDRCLPDLDKLTARIEITSVDDEDRPDTVECDTWLHHFMAREDELQKEERRKHAELDYGNAVTCHRCVSLDTLVETPRGLERIDEIPSSGQIGTHEGIRSYQGGMTYPMGPMFRVKTQSGYTLDVTPEHGFFRWDPSSGDYVRVITRALREGDFLQFLLEPACDPSKLVELPDAPPQDVRTRLHDLPTAVNEDVAEWLGLMVGDWTVYDSGFRLAKRHVDVVDRFEKLCKGLFGARVSRFTKKAYGLDSVPAAEVSSTQIARWCLLINGLAPHQKRVPRVIRNSSLKIQARFLRGLFEDGTVNLKGDLIDHVEWSSCVEELAREVQVMLLRFGIISARTRRDDQWLLYIYGANAHKYRDQIGFVSAFKNDRLQLPTGAETRYLVPVSRDEVAALRPWITQFDRQNTHSRGYMSRDKAQFYAAHLPSLREKLRYHHDRVVKISPLPEAQSACLTVPGLGRFLQNGSPQSNSQGSEWPNVVVFDESGAFGSNASRWRYTAFSRASRQLTVVQ